MPRPLYVSRPLLPKLEDLTDKLGDIWQSHIVTNGGPFHNKLEVEMAQYLGVSTSMLFNNGTIGLLVALKMFDFPHGSEIITTPFTFAATAHAIEWNGLKPVFADISPDTLTLDPQAVEKAITDKTVAILPVHVYGNICDVEGIEAVAKKYRLKVIYDAAHAFGAKINDRPVASYGDASVFSFHATKLFNTIEGGLIATPNSSDKDAIYCLRNFGIKSEEEVVSVGINGKMNEIQAAIGLLNLDLVEGEKQKRKNLRDHYCQELASIDGIRLPPQQDNVVNSQQYFPVIIDQNKFGRSRDDIYNALKERQIFARKYFHPVCTDFVPYKDFKTVSINDFSFVNVFKNQVLCLPFHSGVDEQDIVDICDVFKTV